MTLSGTIATERPDVDQLHATMTLLVVHAIREADRAGTVRRHSTAPRGSSGRVDRATGAYLATANRLTETDRREAGIRRNGQPRWRS